jgi:GTPase
MAKKLDEYIPIFVVIAITVLLSCFIIDKVSDRYERQSSSEVQPILKSNAITVSGKVAKIETSIDRISKGKKSLPIVTTIYLSTTGNETNQIIFKEVPIELLFLVGKDVDIIYYIDDTDGFHIKYVVIHVDPSLGKPEKEEKEVK